MAVPPKNCFTMTWKIENFSMCPKKQHESISSSSFLVFFHNTSWQLILFPRGDEHAGYMACFLARSAATETSTELNICSKISINSVNPEVDFSGLIQRTVKNQWIGFSKFMPLDSFKNHKDSILPNDILTIKCEMWDSNVDNEEFRSINYTAQCLVQTKIRTSNKSVLWPIKCSDLQSDQEQSLEIYPVFDDLPSFLVSFCLTGECTDNKSCLINIERNEVIVDHVLVKCRVSVLNELEKYKVEDEHLFESYVEKDLWILPNFVQNSTLLKDKYFDNTDGVLNLLLQFTFSCSRHILNIGKDESLPPSCFSLGTSETLNPLQKEYKNLYKEGKFSDVTLVVGNKEFKAHKCILSSRSCVFSAMFETDMAEKETGVVNITDLEASTVDLMLSFMYSNILEDITVNEALKLYSAADKYAVESLSKKCRCILKNYLSVLNVGNILSLADLHQDKELFDAVHDFIRANSKSIFLSQEWESFIASNSFLAARVMHKMLL